MRLIFMGSPAEVIPCLQRLQEFCADSANHAQLVGVISQPARPAGRRGQLTDPPVAAYAREHAIPLWQPEKARDPVFLDQLRQLQPDVVVTAAYGQILSDAFLGIPKRATINVHPSLLPKYRGATPVQAALLQGERVTGVSILFTVKALDAGAIIIQEPLAIGNDETADSLLSRGFILGADCLPRALELLRDAKFAGESQNESEVTHCSKIDKADGFLRVQDDAGATYNRFRAYYPWPGTYTYFGDRRVGIIEMRLLESETANRNPGLAQWDKGAGGIVVFTGTGKLLLRRLKPAGGKDMDAASFWNGLKQGGSSLMLPAEDMSG